MASLEQLPPELIARVGARLGARERNALRLAHRRFRCAHEDVTYHSVTLRAPEQAGERLAACLRLKPRLRHIHVAVAGVREGSFDLSPLQRVTDRVELSLHCCGADVHLAGLSKLAARLELHLGPNTAACAEPYVRLMRQLRPLQLTVHASHAALLLDAAVMAQVTWLQVYSAGLQDDGDEDASQELDFRLARRCDVVRLHVHPFYTARLRVHGADALTHVIIDGGPPGMPPGVQAWLNAEAVPRGANRLQQLSYHGVPWDRMHTLAGTRSFVEYLVRLAQEVAPQAKVALDVSYPQALRFLGAAGCVPPGWAQLELVARDDDTYLAARLTQRLLQQRLGWRAPIHLWVDYSPPDALRRLATVHELYDAFRHDAHRDAWHLVRFVAGPGQ